MTTTYERVVQGVEVILAEIGLSREEERRLTSSGFTVRDIHEIAAARSSSTEDVLIVAMRLGMLDDSGHRIPRKEEIFMGD